MLIYSRVNCAFSPIFALSCARLKFFPTASYLETPPRGTPDFATEDSQEPTSRVLIGGYGRMGHTVATLLQTSGIPFAAFDTDPERLAQGRAIGQQVLYGDISDPALLAAAHAERASLVVITVDDMATALQAVALLRDNYPKVPVLARARDLKTSAQVLDAGANQA